MPKNLSRRAFVGAIPAFAALSACSALSRAGATGSGSADQGGSIVLGVSGPRTGACGSVRDVLRDPRANHRVEVVSGLRERESEALLRRFFVERR